MRFEAVVPQDLSKWWDWVSQGVTKIRDLCDEPWRQEDVYANLKAGRSTLFIFWEAQTPVGFIVLELMQDPSSGRPYLNCWLMHLVNRTDGVRQDLCGFLDDCARKAHCKTVRFVSPRKGWQRFLEGEFEPKSVIYERTVE